MFALASLIRARGLERSSRSLSTCLRRERQRKAGASEESRTDWLILCSLSSVIFAEIFEKREEK